MKVFLFVILLAVIGLFVWQLILLIRDVIRKVRAKKIKQAVDKSAEDKKASENVSDRKE